MSLRQFTNSLSIIRRNEHTNRAGAVLRHLYWQGRKLAFPRPVHLRLSRSIITDDEPGGVISLVNMLGLYDFNNMHFTQRVLAGRTAFLDVGANIGAYTLIASENPDAAVLGLEPNPTAFAKLRGNIALNGRENVRAVNLAASARPGVLRMTDNGADPTNRVLDDEPTGQRTILVEVETLDGLCGRLDFVPTLIKIDVEGHEPQVLAGATRCLERVLGCIVENGERRSVVEIMHARGLRGPFYHRHRLGCLQRTPQPLAEDAIFIGPGFERAVPDIAVCP